MNSITTHDELLKDRSANQSILVQSIMYKVLILLFASYFLLIIIIPVEIITISVTNFRIKTRLTPFSLSQQFVPDEFHSTYIRSGFPFSVFFIHFPIYFLIIIFLRFIINKNKDANVNKTPSDTFKENFHFAAKYWLLICIQIMLLFIYIESLKTDNIVSTSYSILIHWIMLIIISSLLVINYTLNKLIPQ